MAELHCPQRKALSFCITDLPEPILRITFVHLDVHALCSAAQTCRLFLRLAGMHSLLRRVKVASVYSMENR